jgi:hypothetical protein
VASGHLGEAPYRYLAIYETDAHPREARRALDEAPRIETLRLSDALDRDRILGWYFEPLTTRVTSRRI